MTTLISATVRKRHPFAPDGAKPLPPYAITVRNGANLHMILETEVMLRYAQRMAWQGKFRVEDERYATRLYTHDAISIHPDDEARVQLWDATVWCRLDDTKVVTANLNTVNEYTTAQDILDFCKQWVAWQLLTATCSAEDALNYLVEYSGDRIENVDNGLDTLLEQLAPETWVEQQ